MEVLRVSAKSSPSAVAGAINSAVRSQGQVEVHAIGAAAVNQAVKSMAIAKSSFFPVHDSFFAVPFFVIMRVVRKDKDNNVISEKATTSMRFKVKYTLFNNGDGDKI